MFGPSLRMKTNIDIDIDIEDLFYVEYTLTSNISPVGLLLRQTNLKRTNIEYITEHAK